MSQHAKSTTLPTWSALLALLVAMVWGFNFIMVKVGLDQIPPLTLCALRFFFACIPAVFFIPKPNAPWKYIIGYGLLTFALQFSLLFAGMAAGVTPGIAALISQLQVFFAIFFAYLLAKQKITRWQMIGAIVSFSGIGVIAWHHDQNCTWLGFALLLSAAITWGIGNTISAKLKAVNMFSLVVWSSLIASFPLLGLAFLLEQPSHLLLEPQQLRLSSILSLAYITYVSTYFGYGCWSWLISKHPVASIALFALLCPIVAMICSAFMLHESLEIWKVIATFLVVSGLCLNVFGQKLMNWFSALFLFLQRKPAPFQAPEME